MPKAKLRSKPFVEITEETYESLNKLADIMLNGGKPIDAESITNKARDEKLAFLDADEPNVDEFIKHINNSTFKNALNRVAQASNKLAQKLSLDIPLLINYITKEPLKELQKDLKLVDGIIKEIKKNYTDLDNLSVEDITTALKNKDNPLRKQLDNQVWFISLMNVLTEEQVALFIAEKAQHLKALFIEELIKEEERMIKLQKMLTEIEHKRSPDTSAREQRLAELSRAATELASLKQSLTDVKEHYHTLNLERTKQYGNELEEAFEKHCESLTDEKLKQEYREFMQEFKAERVLQEKRAEKVSDIIGEASPEVLKNKDTVKNKAALMAELPNHVAMKEATTRFGANEHIQNIQHRYSEDIKNNINASAEKIQGIQNRIKAVESKYNLALTELRNEDADFKNTNAKIMEIDKQLIQEKYKLPNKPVTKEAKKHRENSNNSDNFNNGKTNEETHNTKKEGHWNKKLSDYGHYNRQSNKDSDLKQQVEKVSSLVELKR